MNTITMNKSGLSDAAVKSLVDQTFGLHDLGEWRLSVSEHTDHRDVTFPAIYNFGHDIEEYNVTVKVESGVPDWMV